jgi:hypothetical protein
MGWAENRIQDYQSGDRASWLERRMLEHANPVHFPLALAASAGLAYGLWKRSWPWILGSSALALSGHAYCWTHPARKTYRVLACPAEDTPVARAG